MTKDVLVTLSGSHKSGEEETDEPVEIITPGKYYFKNGKHVILFEEHPDDMQDSTRNLIRFNDQKVEVHKKGMINTDLIFEPDKRSFSSYQTPFGDLDAGISATSIQIEEEADRIDLDLRYALSFGLQPMQDCRVRVQIVPKLSESSGEEGLADR